MGFLRTVLWVDGVACLFKDFVPSIEKPWPMGLCRVTTHEQGADRLTLSADDGQGWYFQRLLTPTSTISKGKKGDQSGFNE